MKYTSEIEVTSTSNNYPAAPAAPTPKSDPEPPGSNSGSPPAVGNPTPEPGEDEAKTDTSGAANPSGSNPNLAAPAAPPTSAASDNAFRFDSGMFYSGVGCDGVLPETLNIPAVLWDRPTGSSKRVPPPVPPRSPRRPQDQLASFAMANDYYRGDC